MKSYRSAKRSIKDRGSIKENAGLHRGAKITKTMNLSVLMVKYRELEDVLYPFATSVGLIHEDMDCTIEEFADMTGVDVEEIILDIVRVVSKH